MFEESFQTATSSRRSMRAALGQGGLISLVPFNLYVNRMPHSRNISTWPSTSATQISHHEPQDKAARQLRGLIPRQSLTMGGCKQYKLISLSALR
jgi:hypothetical protein